MTIDDNDFKIVYIDESHYRTLYRCWCSCCGSDRGYLQKHKAHIPTCRSCSHKGISEDTRTRMSNSHKGKEPINKGKRASAEAISRMSRSRVGRSPPNKGKPTRESTKIKLSCINQGISEGEFNGFKSDVSKLERDKLYEKELHKRCFEREDYTCQACRSRGSILNAHHINSWKFFLEQRYELNNLACLCKSCHKEFHSLYGSGKYTPNTAKQLEEFYDRSSSPDGADVNESSSMVSATN